LYGEAYKLLQGPEVQNRMMSTVTDMDTIPQASRKLRSVLTDVAQKNFAASGGKSILPALGAASGAKSMNTAGRGMRLLFDVGRRFR
jgi:hypothetical protein